MEVALLQWSDGGTGETVRLVGRTTNPDLIRAVQDDLRAQVDADTDTEQIPGSRAHLRVVAPKEPDSGGSGEGPEDG